MTDATSPLRPIAIGRDPYVAAPTRVVLTFEGGGAAGIGHVGALREIDAARHPSRADDYNSWPRYDVRGVAGTSSGAVIAALVAAGYSAEQIFPPAPSRIRGFKGWFQWHFFRLLEYLGWGTRSQVLRNARLTSVMQVFGGPLGRLGFRMLRFFLYHPLASLFAGALFWILLAAAVIWGSITYPPFALLADVIEFLAAWTSFLQSDGAAASIKETVDGLRDADKVLPRSADVALVLMLYLAATPLTVIVLVRYILRGIFSTDRIVVAIDNALIARLNPEAPRPKPKRRRAAGALHVKFGDLRSDPSRPSVQPLSVVAADILGRRLQHFSPETTPNAYVAEAIAASLALPVVFQPVRVATVDGLFFDGGFVSNYPAWAFDDDRTVDQDLFTLGVEIRDRDLSQRDQRQPGRIRRLLRAVAGRFTRFGTPFIRFGRFVLTTIFGSRLLEKRFTRQISIRIDPSDIGILDFGIPRHRAQTLIDNVADAFYVRMQLRSDRRRERAESCAAIAEAVYLARTNNNAMPVIRVALLEADAPVPKFLRTAWLYSSDGVYWVEADDRIRYPLEGSLPGLAWQTELDQIEPLVRNNKFDPKALIRAPGEVNRHRYRHKLIWSATQWALAVPITRGTRKWVLLVASDTPLAEFQFHGGRGTPHYAGLLAKIQDEGSLIAASEEEFARLFDEIDQGNPPARDGHRPPEVSHVEAASS